jgi:pantetheine-phosphate adenylyltransferase
LTTVLYPGSFDPVTYGHIDIATRASTLFDEVVMGIYETPPKRLLFTTEERVKLAKEAVAHLPNVRVESYSELTVKFARHINAKAIIRGLRMSSDFEREFEMAMMNRRLASDIEVVCMMASIQFQFLSSSIIKEVVELGGCVDKLIPPHVASALREKFLPPVAIKQKK